MDRSYLENKFNIATKSNYGNVINLNKSKLATKIILSLSEQKETFIIFREFGFANFTETLVLGGDWGLETAHFN